jgi:EAL domain-containing protein (putative c-di-GMP-specific phosphodiesterase class I)
MSSISGYFRTAAVVYYSETSLRAATRLLSDQGILVRAVDARRGLPADGYGDADIVLCLYPDGSLGVLRDLVSSSFPEGIPLLAVGDMESSTVNAMKAADFIRNINSRGHKGALSTEESIKKVDGITVERLRRALDNGEFELWYQPIIEPQTGRLAGFESLVRWNDADTGKIIFPDHFIPTIESDDIVVPFGFWIMEQACMQMKAWDDFFHCDPPLRVGVNLSARQFTCGVLAEKMVEIIHRFGINSSFVALEITESAFLDDMEAANLALLKLRAEKIKIYLDDFGTGFSSLSYLLHFPVDVIKIDKSFVKWMHVDEQSDEIVKAVIDLAHNLKMNVVAEGVEEKESLDKLAGYGCDFIQGYYYSKPLCAADATAYVAARCGCRETDGDKSS